MTNIVNLRHIRLAFFCSDIILRFLNMIKSLNQTQESVEQSGEGSGLSTGGITRSMSVSGRRGVKRNLHLKSYETKYAESMSKANFRNPNVDTLLIH